ncbi:MAG TPA: GNAT family N-acetyltransferase, partial [Streptosporangiaceae bacterium]|nr:GNAT family N-acetyltransferase [Streptosporangiaceae bacterium]
GPAGQTALPAAAAGVAGTCQAGPVTDTSIRDAAAADTEAIARIAIATGQDEEWSGSDPAYVRYLLARGRMVVAEHHGEVAGFGATAPIGAGPAAITMLCDMFVDPRCHGLGLGQAMLAVLWRDGTPRMTFSSLHAHALPLYARAGLDAWWPLLYLGGDVTVLAAPPGWAVQPATPAAVGGLEREWTGIDRTADHEAWAGRPGGQPVLAERDGQPMAAGTVAGEGVEYGIVHLALAPGCGDAEARDAVLAVLSRLDPPSGRARVCLPAPHPAARPLLVAGWNNDFLDVYMATEPGLLDPRRAVPSPATA